jgi:hypothetical protein
MRRVRYIHWNAGEAQERAKRLKAAGYRVDHEPPRGPTFLRELSDNPPHAVVIDLSRVPSQGRDMALAIRGRKATRHIPLVFVAGDPVKVARVKELLPDAVYTSWEQVGPDLEIAIADAPESPVVPESAMAAYAGTPLPKKLGIKQDSVVVLVGAPAGFKNTLGELPKGAVLRAGTGDDSDLTIWFAKSVAQLNDDMERMVVQAEVAPLWIAWPKKASKVKTDLSQQVVREAGLAAGLVDYKICSIDATWSGLLFTRRKAG